jgi:hypothetical protein
VHHAAALQPHGVVAVRGEPAGEALHLGEVTVRILLVTQRTELVDVSVDAIVPQLSGNLFCHG